MSVHVPDVEAPEARLCWAQGPLMDRCDRRAGHGGRHTWEMEAQLAREQRRNEQLESGWNAAVGNLETAFRDGYKAGWYADLPPLTFDQQCDCAWQAWRERKEADDAR